MPKQLSLLEAQGLDGSSPLSKAIEAFKGYMAREGFTENTVKSFLWDLDLLRRYLGDRPVGRISTADLKGFMDYIQHGRGKPSKPKSYARRLTTLKVFFRWLHRAEVIPRDPAAPIPHRPVSLPLPRVLNEEEIRALQEAAQRLASGTRPDYRPLLLLNLLLSTGMKKTECLNIRLSDLDLADPTKPGVFIRYDNPRMQHKERKLAIPPDLVPLIKAYREQYRPRERLFECTGRNLEYVLHRLARQAGISGGLTFETLRWTAALRDYRAGMPADKLRKKLGLSGMRWAEFKRMLERLAEPL